MPTTESTQVRHTNTQERDSVRVFSHKPPASLLQPPLTHFQPTSKLHYLNHLTDLFPENSQFIDNYHVFPLLFGLNYSLFV